MIELNVGLHVYVLLSASSYTRVGVTLWRVAMVNKDARVWERAHSDYHWLNTLTHRWNTQQHSTLQY